MTEKPNGATTDNINISIDSCDGGNIDKMADNKTDSKDLLGVPRNGHRLSFMEEEIAKDRIRLSLLKQCSAILRQGDQKYTKETLYRAFQDEDLLERIFRLFDVERRDHLVQEDWIEILKERLTEEKQLDFAEQVESVAYVLCGDGVITLDTFQLILKNKVVTNKLLRVIDTDGDGCITADEIMEFISAVSSCRPRVGIDKQSVDRLEQLFRQTVGDQKEITREQFQKIVVSKNPFFTERVFQIFDEDNSGTISHHEFIAAVHRFGRQTPEDKIRFLFKVYDLDGDGLIQHRELQHVMRACMEENGMQFSEPQLLELTSAMFSDADVAQRGAVTCEALRDQLNKHGGLLENLSISIACMEQDGMQFSEPQLLELIGAMFSDADVAQRGAVTWEALRDQLNKHGGLLENLSISIDRWLVPPNPTRTKPSLKQRLARLKPYQLSLPYFKNNYVMIGYLLVFALINLGLFIARIVEYWEANVFVMFARACGQCLNFNCTWLLVLMLRRCLTALRPTALGGALPLDHHVYLHKVTAIIVILYSVWHTTMHLCNFGLVVVNDPVLNANNYTVSEWVLTARPGLFGLRGGWANPTGVALCVVLLALGVSSRPALRKGGCFEVFYFAHLLYIPFWLLLILHAPNFWKWFIVPGTVYVIERIMRLAWLRSERGKTYISSGILLPSRVTHLVLRRPAHFEFHAGDYVFVNIPRVATYEWHPFTISSAPDQPDYIWLHIRGVGEWTNRLYSYFEEQQEKMHASDDILERISRKGSEQSTKSRKGSGPKRSGDISPSAYTNHAFTIDEETEDGFVAISPPVLKTRPSFLSPLKMLEKSRSMPDVRNNVNKKQRLQALRDCQRSESARSFSSREMRRARALTAHSALAHSFRYMRNKPTILACKPPDERRRSNESILSIARRRLSKTLSPDRDIEAVDKPEINLQSPSDADGEDCGDYAVGRPLEIYLDGPYGAASSHIFRAQHAALIAAGIGVTPFASILQSIMYRYWSARATCPKCEHTFTAALPQNNMSLRKVDFFWINREQRSFEWFVSLLSQLEIEQAEAGNERFLEMHMYITSALQRSDMKAVGLQLALDLLHEKEKRDLITGLKTRTNAGRPNWDKVFQRLQEQNKGRVTVFYCGPPQLARILRVKCDQFGFGFRKEVF